VRLDSPWVDERQSTETLVDHGEDEHWLYLTGRLEENRWKRRPSRRLATNASE